MYNISSILGYHLGSTDNIEEIVRMVKSQIPLSSTKESKLRNAVKANIQFYHIEYDGCAIYLERTK